MSNITDNVAVVSDWRVLGVMAHRLRREILRLCWSEPRSVSELAGILKVNPGTALYHVRRLEAVDLLHLADTEKKRGVIEKRYRSVGRTVSFQPPADEATTECLAPLLVTIGKALRAIDPALAVQRRTALVGHIAEARIGVAQQQVVAQRLAKLAHYLERLPSDPDGVPMVLAAGFGPQAELPAAELATSKTPRRRKR
jgi:predicted ArsR family transcriptional regulator